MCRRGHSPEKQAWYRIRTRCNNKNSRDYRHYGARGIFVCERWANSFGNFLADMGTRPSPKHSIERLDNDGPYSPDNCIWAVQKVQTRNQRRTHRITYRGKTQSMADWADDLGISYTLIRRRLRAGWSAEDAFEKPVNTFLARTCRAKRIVCNGESLTIAEWASRLGINEQTLRGRLRYGIPIELILSTTALTKNPRQAKRYTYRGKTQPLSVWARELGLSHKTLAARIRKGWSVERAFTQPYGVKIRSKAK